MLSSLKKMLSLEWTLFKISAIADLQVTFNLWIQFINDILWYLVQIALFESIYLNVNNLGGWGIAEMRVFLGVLFLVDAIHMVLFAHNFDVFSEKIAKKELDLLLLRPVSAQQLMTSQRIQCGFILNAIFAFCWIMWALSLLPGGISWMHFLALLVVVPAGLIVFYSVRMVVCTLALLVTRAEHFHDLFFTFFRMGQRPDRLYGPTLRYFILLVLPVGLVASFPARVLIDPTDYSTLFLLLLGASISLWVVNRFWHWSVKRYMMMG